MCVIHSLVSYKAELAIKGACLLAVMKTALLLMSVTVCLQAAGGAFSILFKGGAGGAVDSIIPTLLQGLDGNAKHSSQVASVLAPFALIMLAVHRVDINKAGIEL